MTTIDDIFPETIFSPKRHYKNVNSLILGILSQRPIAFNPELGRISGSAVAGLFLSQLLYWQGKGARKDCVYKTIKEFQEETCLTRSEQDRAIRKWKELGVLKVKKKGIPPKRHFTIDISRLMKLLGCSDNISAEVTEVTS